MFGIIHFNLVVIIILIIGGGFYAYYTLKPFLKSIAPENANQQEVSTSTSPTNKHPILPPSQEATLEKIGIDPAKLPTTITSAMEACFIEKLGTDRVKAIKDGESPNPIDFLKAKSCLTN